MADGGVVPDESTMPSWFQSARNTVQGLKTQASDAIDGVAESAKTWAQEHASLPTDEPAGQQAKMGGDVQPAVASGAGDVVPVSDLAIDQTPKLEPLVDQGPTPYEQSIGALDQLQESYQSSADAAANSGMQEAKTLGAYQDQAAVQQAKDAQAEALRQEKMDKAEADYQDEIQKFNKMTVDPQRFAKNFWGNASTGQKIIAGIGLIFGGFGNQGGNQSVKIWENAINRDIETQKANIDKAGNYLGQKKGVLASMRDRFGDSRTAELAARRAMYDSAELDLKRIGAMYKGPEAKANMIKALAEIQIKKAELAKDMQKASLEQKAMQAIAGNDRNAQAMAMLPENLRERYVPGYGLALTKDSASKANELVGTYNDAFSGIRQLQGMIKKASSLSPTDRAKASTVAEILKGALRVPIVGPGAVSESEWKLLDNIIADPTTLFSLSSTNKARLEALYSRLQSKLNATVTQYGLRPVNQLSLGDRVR